MTRPALIIQTVYFDESDRAVACQLGALLYNLLTRPSGEPLAYGPGIPVYRAVRHDKVDTDAADRLVVLPVLGNEAYLFKREDVMAHLNKWHGKLGEGHVIPVPTAMNWRREELDLPGKNLLTQLYGQDDRRQRTVDEIVIAVLRLFETADRKFNLFISHAKGDLKATRNAAETIRTYVATDTTAKAFFDANDLGAGRPLRGQINDALKNGVFIAIRTDTYSSRDWCLHELLQAKRNRLPTLTVELLQSGEARSSPYGGNAPTVVWNTDEDPQPVVSRALVECLHAAHFRAEKERLVRMAGLPQDTVDLCRPPELLDLIQGPIQREHTQVVLHPDPELPAAHRDLMAIAHPRLKLVTPTTVFRRIAGSSRAITNPFDGRQIAFSISDSPDVDGPCGYGRDHIDDVAVYLARCLISKGAHLAYGGDFRQGGFTEIFSELISSYRQTAGGSDDILHSYLAAIIQPGDAPDNLPIKAHHLDRAPLKGEAVLPAPGSPEGADVPKALYFSDMRRVMTRHMLARVILGGASKPEIVETNQRGYGGLYPGVVEEAWWTLKERQPLYVIGGFGGAAGILAALMDGGQTPEEMLDGTWSKYPSYRDRAGAITSSPYSDILAIPKSMAQMTTLFRGLAAAVLKSDETAVQWNGLTLAENRALRWTRDPVQIVSLVFLGLQNYWRSRISGKLEIELVEGPVTAAQDLDAIAVGVFEGIPLGGAAAALDRMVSGRASLSHESGQALVSLASSEVAADFLCLASLGKFGALDVLTERIQEAAAETARCALRHGFSRLGVVAFGGSITGNSAKTTDAMLTGLKLLSGQATIAWFENDPDRFSFLQQILERDNEINLTTRRLVKPAAVASPEHAEQLVLSVTLTDGVLISTIMPPAGTAVARSLRRQPFTRQDMITYSRGAGGRNTPSPADLTSRGRELSSLLFGDDADDLISRCRDAKFMLIHDVTSSQLPFEILLAGTGSNTIRPAVGGGINRRLAVPGVSAHRLFAKPPHTGKLKVMVVIDPTGDLTGAAAEGQQVVESLKGMSGVEPIILTGRAATKSAFLEALASADVLHYCGHAFFDGPGKEDSGLNLSDAPLFFTDLIGFPSSVRIVFANACEAGRVRKVPELPDEAASFAEYFLRTGIEAYLGTYWRVADTAAATFASQVYASLAAGNTLDRAVRDGRAYLLNEINSPEWANYVLYGEGRFQLVRGQASFLSKI